jgi:hypothetical protein
MGITPGSHRLAEHGGQGWKRDIVTAAPQGSVILYDSFTEAHELDNNSSEYKTALYAWYRVPAVWSGHSPANFGPKGVEATMRWRKHVEERLLPEVMDARKMLNAPCNVSEMHWGFPVNGKLVPWGEERVCFRCDRTTGSGAMHGGMWFCNMCWPGAKGPAPLPAAYNAVTAEPKPDDYREEWMIAMEEKGFNIKPSRGRHKLTLLRERGCFLPVDPTTEWLDHMAREPQPEGWKVSLRKAMGEIPRAVELR